MCYGVLVGISDLCFIILSLNFLFFYDPAKNFRKRTTGVTHLGGRLEKVETPRDEGDWEGIPKLLFKRLFWALDLVASICALHWSYGLLHSHYYYQPVIQKNPSLSHNFSKLLLICLGVDCLKELIALDPYFWGYIDHSPPRYILNNIGPNPDLPHARLLRCHLPSSRIPIYNWVSSLRQHPRSLNSRPRGLQMGSLSALC